MNPLISIVIPTYNRGDVIVETLNSIVAQTYTNWECIVVDDGSSDNTELLIQTYIKDDERFKYYKRPEEKSKGPNSCRNFGFKSCKGDVVHFFDSDDLYKKDALEAIVSEFRNGLDAVVSKVELIDFESREVFKENNITSERLIEDFFIEKINFYICGPFWRKSFLEQQNYLFDEDLGNGDDWDFNMRMLYKKPKLGFLDKVLMQIRIHSNSFSREKRKFNIKQLESDFSAIEKHYHLIKRVAKVNLETIENHIIKRFNSYFVEALLKNNDLKKKLLVKVLKKEFEFKQYGQFFRTIFGYITYSLFKKGYGYLHIK